MKIYEVIEQHKFFTTLAAAQRYVLSLGMIKEVMVEVDEEEELKRGYYTNKRIYCKKKYVNRTDFNDYEFYDSLKSKMSYTDFLLKNKCLDCNTTIYFENKVAPITIKEIEVIE